MKSGTLWGAAFAVFRIMGSAGAACKISDKACGTCQCQCKEEQKNTDEDRAENTCCDDSHGQQNDRQQDSAQYTDQHCTKSRTQAFTVLRSSGQRSCNCQNSQIHDGDTECDPKEYRGYGNHSGDLKKCGNDTNDYTGDDCGKGAAAFATTIEQ